MIIRTAISIELQGWNIIYKENGKQVHATAIPPTTGDRIDVIVETREDNGFKITQRYLYNYTGNLKKLKGEKIIIMIKSGKPSINFTAS